MYAVSAGERLEVRGGPHTLGRRGRPGGAEPTSAEVPRMIAAIERFAREMDALWREPISDSVRWDRVKGLMPILLDDPVLRNHASRWNDTNGDGSNTVKNLLLYED